MRPIYYGTTGLSLVIFAGSLALGFIPITVLSIGIIAVSSLAFWLERRNLVLTGRVVFNALMFGVVTLGLVLIGTYSPAAYFYSWPLLVALLLLGPEIAMGMALAAGALLVVFFGLERFALLYSPPVHLDPFWQNTLTLAGAVALLASAGHGYLHLSRRLLNMQGAMRQQQAELAEILAQQAQSRAANQVLGQEVAATAHQLLATSQEQAAGAAQQVEAIVQVTDSMQELSQTATQIAERSHSVQEASSEVLQSAQVMAATTAQVSEFSRRGQKSVQETAASNQTMHEVYQGLNRSLQELSERSVRVQAMLDLIETIADETHLLSLNATIEAAGAGEFGERFGVVAQEVKNLTDRARKSSGEVREVVTEMVSALRGAREEAVKGTGVAEKAAGSARQSSQVITEYETMVRQAVSEAAEIAEYAAKMEELAREIGTATRFQQDATEQMLGALLTVQTAAEINADSSNQIAGSTGRLQELASQLG
jgi:methyl-accepting chemotaxis protein